GGPYVVREASLADAHAIARVYVETARVQDAGIVSLRALAQLSVGRLAHRWSLLLANRKWVKAVYVAEEREVGVIGFAAGGPTRRGASDVQAKCRTGRHDLRQIAATDAAWSTGPRFFFSFDTRHGRCKKPRFGLRVHA